MSQENDRPNSRSQCTCVVLLSGGIDSAACVDFYQRQNFSIRALHVSYGQPSAQQEATAAKAIAKHFRIPLKFVGLDSACRKSASEMIGRNAFLLFTALLEIELPTGILAFGIHSGTPYYDCSPSFLSTVQTLIDGYCGGRIQVAAPFLEWTKKEIWEYAIQHQMPLELTFSCERGLEQPCGLCLSCRDLEALRVC